MRLLILGGTVFLGRHVAAEALARGHEVTLLHRGLHGSELFPSAEHLSADRTGDLSAVEGRRWDAAIDTSGYEPQSVAASTRRLSDAGLSHLVFVSSASVYPAWPAEPVTEDSPVWSEGGDYGPLKAASERAAEAIMPGRVAHVRAGLICGPHDNILRLPWWVRRIAAGGDVVAPGEPARTVQLVDARDLAAWMLDLAEQRRGGTFNATAPPGRDTMGEVLDAAVAVTGSGARLTWIPDNALVAAGVEPWDELPLWLPEADMPGAWRVDTARAQRAGLRCRPIGATVADVWAWLRAGGEQGLGDWRAEHRPRALSAQRERVLLAAAAAADDR
jgi:nucleoside-diphosphate-sugar epimerase